MKLGKRILSTRLEKGFSQTALARKTGLANSTVCDIEKERLSPSLDTLEKIANALDVHISIFFLPPNSGDNEKLKRSGTDS